MKSPLPWVSLLALLMLNMSCSDNTASNEGGAADLPQSEADLLASRAPTTPVISPRAYTSGSANVKVTGSFQVDAEIPINTQGSHSDVGLSATLGKKTALAGADACKGSMNVTDKLISGSYKCTDAASHDPGETSNFGMG